MTLTQKDSTFIRYPVVVPTSSASYIKNFEGLVDENILNFFKAVVNDLDNFKISIHGIRRRYDDMLFIYNYPTQKGTDPQEALRMDKYGNFAIGTEYPRWERCLVDVNGPLYAIPQYGLWSQTVNIVGVGLYTWDTELFNPNSDIYARATANTQIKIDEPGSYDIRANIFVQDTAAATGDGITIQLRHNAVAIAGAVESLAANDLAWFHVTKIVNVSRGDLIDVNLLAPATSARFGNATTSNTWLEICKVN